MARTICSILLFRRHLRSQFDRLLRARQALQGKRVVSSFKSGMPGCSGLELKHRPGLRQSLRNVASKPIYNAIIVYDLSRWGRLQSG